MKLATVLILWTAVIALVLLPIESAHRDSKTMTKDNDTEDGMRPKESDAEECLFCRKVITCLEDDLEDHPEETLEEALGHVCEQCFSGEEHSRCEAFVEEYGNDIVNMYSEEVPLSQACYNLALCPSSASVGRIVADP